MMKYKKELVKSMTWLGQKKNTVFLGQTVSCSGSAMFGTLSDIPIGKRIEMPVAEELQMGIATGISLTNLVPITIYPRFDFLLSATNQLVNNLDKFSKMSNKRVQPKIIIRVGIGSTKPMHPGPQHFQDHSEAFEKMLTTVEVIKLVEPEDIMEAYKKAYNRTDGKSTLLVEYMDYYEKK